MIPPSNAAGSVKRERLPGDPASTNQRDDHPGSEPDGFLTESAARLGVTSPRRQPSQ